MKKVILSFSAFLIVVLMAIPCFAAISADTGVVSDNKTIIVSFDEITISGQGPIGVELVKTDNDKVTVKYLNVENKERYTVTQSLHDRKMQINITNTSSQQGINVQFGPEEEYKNVIRLYIPNAEYTKFIVNANHMVVHMQDFNASVQATGERGGIYLKDDSIALGTYSINVKSGPVSIEAATITSDIKASVDGGPITLRFREQPKNLYLDTTNCGPVVTRPDTWAAKYKIGDGTPEIILTNTNGRTAVEVD